MFAVVQDAVSSSLQNAKAIHDIIKRQEYDSEKTLENKTLKGLFFIALYGAVERCVTYSVTICIESINNLHLDLLKIKPVVWALILDPDCTRMEQCNDKKWTYRNKLFSEIKNVKAKNIIPTLFPTSIGNIKKAQIEGIWKTFDIQSEMFPDPSVIGRLNDLAQNRMFIAHGDKTASEVGSNYSSDDLLIFYDKIKEWSSYLISCFDSYIKNEEYKV